MRLKDFVKYDFDVPLEKMTNENWIWETWPQLKSEFFIGKDEYIENAKKGVSSKRVMKMGEDIPLCVMLLIVMKNLAIEEKESMIEKMNQEAYAEQYKKYGNGELLTVENFTMACYGSEIEIFKYYFKKLDRAEQVVFINLLFDGIINDDESYRFSGIRDIRAIIKDILPEKYKIKFNAPIYENTYQVMTSILKRSNVISIENFLARILLVIRESDHTLLSGFKYEGVMNNFNRTSKDFYDYCNYEKMMVIVRRLKKGNEEDYKVLEQDVLFQKMENFSKENIDELKEAIVNNSNLFMDDYRKIRYQGFYRFLMYGLRSHMDEIKEFIKWNERMLNGNVYPNSLEIHYSIIKNIQEFLEYYEVDEVNSLFDCVRNLVMENHDYLIETTDGILINLEKIAKSETNNGDYGVMQDLALNLNLCNSGSYYKEPIGDEAWVLSDVKYFNRVLESYSKNERELKELSQENTDMKEILENEIAFSKLCVLKKVKKNINKKLSGQGLDSEDEVLEKEDWFDDCLKSAGLNIEYEVKKEAFFGLSIKCSDYDKSIVKDIFKLLIEESEENKRSVLEIMLEEYGMKKDRDSLGIGVEAKASINKF